MRRAGQLTSLIGLGRAFHVPFVSPTLVLERNMSATAKLVRTLKAEARYEVDEYEKLRGVRDFLSRTKFKLIDNPGDLNLCLERAVGQDVMRVEWQLATPYHPDLDVDDTGYEGEHEQNATDFVITIEQPTGAGVAFYCSTHSGEDHRYVVGNVRHFGDEIEKESIGAYNGPEFDDLDDRLQESLDEYLDRAGMTNEVCDLIDAMGLDKEQREYIRWLEAVTNFIDS